MPEPAKNRFAEWWKYETSVCFRACRETGKASLGRGLFVTVIALIGRWWFGFMSQHEIWAQILIFIGAGVVVYLGEFLFKLLRASAKMAKEQEQKNEKYNLELAEKGAEIAELKASRSEEALNDAVDRLLSVYFENIEGWIGHLKLVELGILKDADILKEISNSSDLCLQIQKFIKEKIGPLEAADFGSTSDIIQTPTSGSPEDTQIRMLIDFLSHRASKLREIMRKRMKTHKSLIINET